MIIVTWNVNGLRSILGKGFEEWLLKLRPDVLALQEIKAQQQDVEKLLTTIEGDYNINLFPAQKKGYSGTALFVRKDISIQKPDVHLGIGEKLYDLEGRLIWIEFDDFILLNGYFPNGQRDHSRVEFKLDFSQKVFSLASHLQEKTNKGIIICGDINTAHNEIDLANPKANANTTGFLPLERAFVDKVIRDGFVDVFRHFYQNKEKQYTWWTYRGDCRSRNIGWRLDYFFTSKNMISKINKIEHLTEVYGSDHCPVLLEIKELADK